MVQGPKGTHRKKWVYLLIPALAASIWWMSHKGGEKDKRTTPPAQVTVAPAVRQNVPIRIALVGNVVAYETVAVTSRLDSQVVNVLFKDGDAVTEGQTLFELDDRTLLAQIKQYEAALAKEKAQLANNRLQYERAQKLVQTNTVAQAQLDQAKAAYEAQLAQVGAAQANLDATRVMLSYTTIIAPISGRTGTISVTRGNNVKANDTLSLVTINQVQPIRVQFSIPQRYYQPVRTAMEQEGGLSVTAINATPQVTQEGKLEYVDNTIDVGNGTFAARAIFANEDETLWPGMFVNVTLELGTRMQALTIPSVAVQGDEGQYFVFVLDEENRKAVRTPVKIEQFSAGIAIVSEGVQEGVSVITDGMLRVTDGAAVEVTQAGESNADKTTSEDQQ